MDRCSRSSRRVITLLVSVVACAVSCSLVVSDKVSCVDNRDCNSGYQCVERVCRVATGSGGAGVMAGGAASDGGTSGGVGLGGSSSGGSSSGGSSSGGSSSGGSSSGGSSSGGAGGSAPQGGTS